jgi:uncharacterized protein YlxW (UPF0749 family)
MRRRSSQLAVGAVLLLLGFLVVVQARFQATDSALSGLSVQELGELVGNLTTRNNQLREEIRGLESQRSQVAAAVARGDTSAAQIRNDLNRILGWSGVLGVTGTGVTVNVDGPLPGDEVETLINELRNAGAEAVSIGEIRVVPGVVVSGAGGSLVVAGVPLADPLEIRAIGNAETLSGSLTRAGGPIAQLAASYPEVAIGVTAEQRVSVPPTDRDLAPRLGKPRL